MLQGKLALITGATRGIGAAVAERYAQEGADLILIGRRHQDLERIDDVLAPYGRSVTLVPLDLRQFASIDELADQVTQHFGRLDILVGNAGILGKLMPLTHLPHEIWHEVWQVNFLANWHLLKAFEPLLTHSPAGRGIFVTSGITQGVQPFWGGYSLTKKALEEMIFLYGAENPNSSFKVNLIDPGPVRTQMNAQALPGRDPLTLPLPAEITDIFVELGLNDLQATGQIFKAFLTG